MHGDCRYVIDGSLYVLVVDGAKWLAMSMEEYIDREIEPPFANLPIVDQPHPDWAPLS
jgi:hypothetical protein